MSEHVRGIDGDLHLLFTHVNELRDLAAETQLDDSRIYAFKIRWGTMLAGRLQRLAFYYQNGKLSADERTRYEDLRSQLRDVLPLIDRLDLGPVGVPLEG